MTENRSVAEMAQPVDEEQELLEAEDLYTAKRSIETAAYYLSLERNRYAQPGDELSDWLQAEKKIKETET